MHLVPPRTPLHYAAANCNYQCLFALVGSGASVNDLDERGCTPLHYAAASDTDGKSVQQINNAVALLEYHACFLPVGRTTVALTYAFSLTKVYPLFEQVP